ncbi:MAG: hypothetical protein CMH84_08200 [Nocardioides sp.]|nr:hypothetical protein [Nocardioides sp.]
MATASQLTESLSTEKLATPSTSSFDMPASANALRVASAAKDKTVRPELRDSGVYPTPAMATSRMHGSSLMYGL